MNRLRYDDTGSALVEFSWLAILLIVPLVYVVLTAVQLQRTAFAETAAARDAARAYATAGSDAIGQQRATAAIALAMSDQGVTWSPDGTVVDCGTCTYQPGSTFTVRLHTTVALPFVPHWLCGDRCVGIPVTAHAEGRVDCWAADGRAPDPSC